MLYEAVPVIAANHRVAQVEVFDAGLELTPVPFADASAKNTVKSGARSCAGSGGRAIRVRAAVLRHRCFLFAADRRTTVALVSCTDLP